MKNVPLLVGTLIGSLLLIIGIAYFFSGGAPTSENGLEMYDPAEIAGEKTHVKGVENPEITIVEFSDFQCPACQEAAPMVDQIVKSYPNQVQVIYRHFPLDQIHPNARTAALASEVVAESGKFWEYHDILFARQADWEAITDRSKLKEMFADFASELEIDKASFLEKIEDASIAEKVQNDVTVANNANVNATPTFFVNGQKVLATDLLPLIESLLETNTATESTAASAANVDAIN